MNALMYISNLNNLTIGWYVPKIVLDSIKIFLWALAFKNFSDVTK